MNISGYGMNTSYYGYIYSSSVHSAGLTSDSMNPVGDLLSSKVQNQIGMQTASNANVIGSGSSAFGDIMTMQYKLLKEQEYDAALEDARINDPMEYEQMQSQRKQDIAKSFRQVEELAKESGDGKTGMATYNGVPITFDFQNSIMTVGDMSAGNDIIHVGKLSNGYAFSFNRDNIGDISKILDLFSPEDVNKIMEAITTDNIAKSMEQEIEDEKAKVGKAAASGADETDANTAAADTSQIDSVSAGTESNGILNMLSPVIEDLDKSKAVGGKDGIGTSTGNSLQSAAPIIRNIYYINRANNAYEDSFVYSR